jgi:hypothetical protein
MTTVLNPASSPTIIYNKGGRNIQSITVNPSDGFVSIPYVSGETVCLVTLVGGVTIGSDGVKLPSGCSIGDTVEIYVTNALGGGSFIAELPTGEAMVYNGAGYTTADVGQAARFMKVSSTTWVSLR